MMTSIHMLNGATNIYYTLSLSGVTEIRVHNQSLVCIYTAQCVLFMSDCSMCITMYNWTHHGDLPHIVNSQL